MLKARLLCTATALDVCRTLKGVDMDIRPTPGTRLANDRTGEVVDTPPEGEARLRDTPFGKEKLFIHPKRMRLLSRDSNAFQFCA